MTRVHSILLDVLNLHTHMISTPGPMTGTRQPGFRSTHLLYPYTVTIAPGVEIELEEGDMVQVEKESDDSHILVRVAKVKKAFMIPRNFLDL